MALAERFLLATRPPFPRARMQDVGRLAFVATALASVADHLSSDFCAWPSDHGVAVGGRFLCVGIYFSGRESFGEAGSLT